MYFNRFQRQDDFFSLVVEFVNTTDIMGPIHGSFARKITADFGHYLNDYLQHGCISRFAALLFYSAKYECSDLD